MIRTSKNCQLSNITKRLVIFEICRKCRPWISVLFLWVEPHGLEHIWNGILEIWPPLNDVFQHRHFAQFSHFATLNLLFFVTLYYFFGLQGGVQRIKVIVFAIPYRNLPKAE